jgi:hypothetical protein
LFTLKPSRRRHRNFKFRRCLDSREFPETCEFWKVGSFPKRIHQQQQQILQYNEPIEDSANVSQAQQDDDSIDSTIESDNASYGPETQETNTNNIGFDNGFKSDASLR